jgi:hypothetical protein
LPEDYGSDDVEIWPENERAVNLFIKLSTQWRAGMGGLIGLDYSPLFVLMERMKLTDADFDQVFDDIRVIEREALTQMTKKD